MPKFLEAALRHMGRRKGLQGEHLDHYVFGAMNNAGAMHGNKITPKGEAMEEKHERETGDSLVAKTAALMPRRRRDGAG